MRTRGGEPLLRSIELFSGSGGLAIGTHLAGFRHRALVEWNPLACATLRANAAGRVLRGIQQWEIIERDARQIDFSAFGPVDLVAGGPPCQPFSIAGKHGGMEDPRDMFPQYVRAIRELRPRAFIAENVRGLLRPAFAEYLAYIEAQLAFPGLTRRPRETWAVHAKRIQRAASHAPAADRYVVGRALLNAADYGVPQVRRRMVMVGIRADLGVQWTAPPPTHSHAALQRDQGPFGTYWERHGISRRAREVLISANARRPNIDDEHDARCEVKPWRTVRDAFAIPFPLPEPTLEDSPDIVGHAFIPGARTYVGHTGSDPDQPAKTLKAGVHGVPGGENMLVLADGGVRYFTIREAARLQTFPDDWTFHLPWTIAMRQLGNAVPIDMARLVANSVSDIIAPANSRVVVRDLPGGASLRFRRVG